MIRCLECDAVWSDGVFTAGCEACGGGPLYRTCPICNGLCGADWSRAVLDSQDSGIAHWNGGCALDLPQKEQTHNTVDWWLDESALPDLIWSALMVGPEGAIILHEDGSAHALSSKSDAEEFLREDEYDQSVVLRSLGQLASSAHPPTELVNRVRAVLETKPA